MLTSCALQWRLLVGVAAPEPKTNILKTTDILLLKKKDSIFLFNIRYT